MHLLAGALPLTKVVFPCLCPPCNTPSIPSLTHCGGWLPRATNGEEEEGRIPAEAAEEAEAAAGRRAGAVTGKGRRVVKEGVSAEEE